MGPIKPLAAVFVVLASGWCPPKPTTSLMLESYGAFSYVKAANNSKFEMGYLETINNTAICNHVVTKEGLDLFVESGIITSPNPPLDKIFDLTGALVTFPELEAAGGQIDADRDTTKPICATWTDLTCVASVSTQFPFDPTTWKSAMNAVIRITKGNVEASVPSDVSVEQSQFDFKPLLSTTALFTQKMTDRVITRASHPGKRVLIKLENYKGTPRELADVSEIIVEPDGNRPVKLKLTASHSHGVATQINPGDPIEHFCAFYASRQPFPSPATQLLPHLEQAAGNVGGGTVNLAGGGLPSPGPNCPPDWTWP